ncbi:hypothetical protein [Kitasatospora sp. NPDC088134]|uniref:hypothetical protein n=1 Tax=Kitasatospora sp. NPDC088134 TaxID=3364071 RepID=UPI00382267C9
MSRWSASTTTMAMAAGLLAVVAFPARAEAEPAPPAAGPTRATALDPAVAKAQRAAAAKARADKKPVVVDALTTENTQTIANPDGTFTLTQNAGPVRARKNNAWVPVDTVLTRRPDGTFVPGATDADLAFSGGGSGPLVTMTREGKTVQLTWPTALPTPTVKGDTATYPQVLPDVDLTVTAHADGFSQVLVVKTPRAAADPALATLKLATRTDGVTLSQTDAGDAEAKDSSGRTVFRADPPLVWDSAVDAMPGAEALAAAKAKNAEVLAKDAKPGREPASAKAQEAPRADSSRTDPGSVASEQRKSSTAGPGTGAHSTRMGMKVAKDGITLTPDQSVLTGKDTVYPLYIDPAWSGNPSVVAWASINDMGWKATTGNEAKLGNLGNWPRCASYCYSVHRSYFEMNTDGFRGAKVTKAVFRPYFSWAADSTARPTEIWVDPDFPGNLSWSNKPGSGSSNYVTAETSCIGHGSDGCAPGGVDFTVTGAAQNAASGGWRNFEVDAKDESDMFQWKKIDPTQTFWTVTYYYPPSLDNQDTTSPSVTFFGDTYLNSSNVTMKATGSGTYEQIQSGYEIWNWSNGSATSTVASGLFSNYTANGGSYTYTGLADGSYAWRGILHSQDGDMWSGWTQWHPFIVDTVKPSAPGIRSTEFPQGEFGAGLQDRGTFRLTGSTGITGYVVSLDSDLSSYVWSETQARQGQPPTWAPGQQITRGQQYWVPAGSDLTTAPGTVGPHRLYARSVGHSGIVSDQTVYSFWAGTASPTYVYGDQLVNGYTATNDDRTQTVVPQATWQSTGGAVHPDYSPVWADGAAAKLHDASPTSRVRVGDSATFAFDVPHSGYWDISASLGLYYPYGQYTLTLDDGTADSSYLGWFDGWVDMPVGKAARFVNFGTPNAHGSALRLAQGTHTVTIKVTGTGAHQYSGYQAAIDYLRLTPMSTTCTLSDLSGCYNNVAISSDGSHEAADADGGGNSLSAGKLGAAGWTPGRAITVNGAPMTVPNYASNKADNILAGGQTVNVDTTGSANSGNAIVFLGFSTTAAVNGASGTITYPKKTDGSSTCGTATSYPYTIDSVPDWVAGPTSARTVALPGRNLPGTATDTLAAQLFAVSVALPCPGLPISSISLPVVTTKAMTYLPALHILGLGIRPASYVPGSGTDQNWTGTWGTLQDFDKTAVDTRTQRTAATITIGGANARIRLSNARGSLPVTLDHASIAHQASGATPTGTPVELLFGGAKSVTIPAGGEITSDPVAFATTDGERLLISYHLAAATSDGVGHRSGKSTATWLTAPGVDATTDSTGTPFTTRDDSRVYWLSGIDVAPTSNNTGALALFGDQTVHSDTAMSDGTHSLNDLIHSRVVQAYNADNIGNPAPYGVLNLARDSWTAGANLLPVLSGSSTQLTPGSAGNPIDSSVLNAANVHSVLISTGTDDILANATAGDVENRLTALAQQIRQRYADANGGSRKISVYLATVPPNPAITGAQETVRRTVNNYILCGKSDPTAGVCTSRGPWLNGNADGAIDFAAAVATDHTATGPLNTGRDFNTDPATGKQYPNQTYYQDLAAQYVADSVNAGTSGGGGVSVPPM